MVRQGFFGFDQADWGVALLEVPAGLALGVDFDDLAVVVVGDQGRAFGQALAEAGARQGQLGRAAEFPQQAAIGLS